MAQLTVSLQLHWLKPMMLAMSDMPGRSSSMLAPVSATSRAFRSISTTDWGASTTMEPISCSSAAYIVWMTSSSGSPISRAMNNAR